MCPFSKITKRLKFSVRIVVDYKDMQISNIAIEYLCEN